jgi:hypothetical protein
VYENYQSQTELNAKNKVSNVANTVLAISQTVGIAVTGILEATQKARDREKMLFGKRRTMQRRLDTNACTMSELALRHRHMTKQLP